MTYGSVMASFNVEQFGTERVQALTHGEINRRFEEFRLMTHLDAAAGRAGLRRLAPQPGNCPRSASLRLL